MIYKAVPQIESTLLMGGKPAQEADAPNNNKGAGIVVANNPRIRAEIEICVEPLEDREVAKRKAMGERLILVGFGFAISSFILMFINVHRNNPSAFIFICHSLLSCLGVILMGLGGSMVER